ncbi:MAG: hypothetical protein ACREP6_09995, partial [Candidatus Binataceae bacterium]
PRRAPQPSATTERAGVTEKNKSLRVDFSTPAASARNDKLRSLDYARDDKKPGMDKKDWNDSGTFFLSSESRNLERLRAKSAF